MEVRGVRGVAARPEHGREDLAGAFPDGSVEAALRLIGGVRLNIMRRAAGESN